MGDLSEATPLLPGAAVGVVGGGQLGRYFVLEARRLGYQTWVLDPDKNAPAMQLAEHCIVANYDDQQALDCVRQFGAIIPDDDGLSVAAGMGGHKGSSYRSELLGTITAIAWPGPNRIGIDSQACVNTATNLQHIALSTPVHIDTDSTAMHILLKHFGHRNLTKPWNLQPNGDLKRLLFQFIRTKGPSSL